MRRLLFWLGALVVVTVVVASSWMWVTWPDVEHLATARPETTAFIERYRARQRADGESDRVQWTWVESDRVSPHLKRAIVAAEDMEFFSHEGVSRSEMRAAVKDAIRERRPPRGASTITQQLAKNLWLSPSRNPLRKAKEVLLTKQLERHLTKGRLLELYVNIVEFGRGIYGVEAAARHYFGKAALNLDPHESAMLAASLPRPSSWHPGVESQAYARYVADIEARVIRAEFLARRIPDLP